MRFSTGRLAVVLGMALVLAAAPGPVGSQAVTDHVNMTIPWENVEWVIPCLNGGAGDTIVMNGLVHYVFQTTTVRDTVHVKWHYQPMGLTGVSQATGDLYHATGVTQGQYTVRDVSFPYHETYVNRAVLATSGPGNNWHLIETFRMTINANGETTVDSYQYEAVCQ